MTHYAGKGGLRRPQKEHRGPESEKTGSDGVFGSPSVSSETGEHRPSGSEAESFALLRRNSQGGSLLSLSSFSIFVLHALNLYNTIFLEKSRVGILCKSMREAEGLFWGREREICSFGRWTLQEHEILPTFPLVGSLYLFSLEEGVFPFFLSRDKRVFNRFR